jgi:hypothetical protein
MRRPLLALGLVLAAAAAASALELSTPRIEATLFTTSAKDPFRIRATLTEVDLAAVIQGPVTVRFGALRARVPAGGFRKRGKNLFTWRSYLFGVKKVTVNVRKATIDVVGGGIELDDLAGPVTLAIGTGDGAVCARVTWEPPVPAKKGKASRLVGVNPLEPCTDVGATSTAPQVLITTPTDLAGVAIGAATVSLAGLAWDDVAVTALSWTNDRGGGGTLPVSGNWTIADVALQPGDNRITVTATDAQGNVGSDAIDVTYNDNGLAFDGLATANPDYLFADTLRAVTMRQGVVANSDLDPGSVELVRVIDTGLEPVKAMADDGDLGSGDQIQGDGYYSALVSLDGRDGTQRFRVAARTLSQPGLVAYSPVITLPVIEHVSTTALASATALADDATAMLSNLTAKDTPPDEALAEVVALTQAYGVAAVGLADGGQGAWWVTADGLLGGALGYDQSTQRGAVVRRPATRRARAPQPRVVVPSGLPGDPVQVGTRRTAILAPHFDQAEPADLNAMLAPLTCPTFEVETFMGTFADAEQFKALEDYGNIVIASHGDALFGGLGAAYRPEWAWSTPGAQVVVLTATILSQLNLQRWEADLRLGRLAVMPGGAAAILPSYITRYSIRLPGSLVYVGSCNSLANPTLSTAFIGRGALTVMGYDGYVESEFARDRSVALFTDLLAGQSIAEAFTPGQRDAGQAEFTMAGSTQTSLTTEVIVNASFEFASGFIASVSGFNVIGDGRVVGGLGSWLPTDGNRMALVSTGLGLTRASGSFAQPVCLPPLPPGATQMTLSYDWNFFSEEFLEYCGSQFQDSFEVSFGTTSLQSSKVDDLCPIVMPDPIDFDRGDVHTTGWLTQTVDVTAFAGTTDVLRFAAADVGDSIYDSAILVDSVRLTVE